MTFDSYNLTSYKLTTTQKMIFLIYCFKERKRKKTKKKKRRKNALKGLYLLRSAVKRWHHPAVIVPNTINPI